MRINLLCLILLVTALSSTAQHNLSGSIQHSPYTYVYRIDKKEAALLEKTELQKVNEKYLRSLVDSFKTGEDEPPVLKEGNYLFVHANKNQLIYKLYTTRGVDAKLISNDHDVFVTVHSAEGAVISNATVYLDRKKLSYNSRSQSYGPVKHRKAKLIKVEYNDVAYSFSVSVQKMRTWKTSWLRKLTYAFPLKYIFNPSRIKNAFRYPNFFYRPTLNEFYFKSFIVFNKPVYKPGDTVRLKAFVETNKGKLLNKPLLVRISDSNLDTDTIIATIKPYRPGGYEYEFVLNDSLDLSLDDDYLITLEELKSRKYDLDEYDGDLDDNEYAGKRKVVARGKFKHEDYELTAVSFKARSNKSEHTRGEEAAIFLKATDENDLAVMDGRVEILVRTNQYDLPTFKGRKVFLPNTLWFHTQPLETVGETKIVLPDSIFPRASFNYNIECVFLNANNEMQNSTLSQKFNDETGAISFEQKNNSLYIDHRILGKTAAVAARLTMLKDKDSIGNTRNIILPAAIKINPFATGYEVETDSLYELYDVSQAGGAVSCLASRTKDSVMVQLANPNHLPVWYTIFAGEKIVHRGYGDSLFFAERSRTAKNYFVSLQYIYGNKVRKENYTIPFRDKQITVRTEQPEFIYPGQTVDVGVHLTDASGKPVANADVTAYSFTSKFDAGAPDVPYLGKYHPLRLRKPELSASAKLPVTYSEKMNWERWSRELNLDTIEYYNFLHPKGMYKNTEPAPDSLTQLAPFVVYKGDILPVHHIYIDGVPVYFSQTRHTHRYSFRIEGDLHSVRLRTKDYMIYLDTLRLTKGVKTILSVEADTSNNKIRIEKMPDTLTTHERNIWSKYLILVQNTFDENYAYIKQHNNVFLLNDKNNKPGLILTGPYVNYWSKLVVKNKFEQGFDPEGSWQFIIREGLIKQRQLLNMSVFSSRLASGDTTFDFHDLVLTEKEIDSLWQDYLDDRSSKIELFRNSSQNMYGSGRLQIGLSREFKKNNPFIKNLILFRYDNADFIRIYPGSTRDLGYLHPGMYRLMFLLKKNHYFIKDSIEVLPNGINYYEQGAGVQFWQDSVSLKIAEIVEGRSRFDREGGQDLERIKETFNDRFLDPSTFPETVSGFVKDKDGNPIPFASIRVKGTNMGVSADAYGRFTLRTPKNGYIVIAAVGFTERELRIDGRMEYNVVLLGSQTSLNEVVVVGYGVSRKKELTGSVATISSQTLAGKVAGVIIRGSSSISDVQPMIIVDGLPFSGKLEDLDKNQVDNIRILKGEEATATYGSMATAGVIIVTTKNAKLVTEDGQPIAGNTLRRNFRDDAYWQPKLTTDANGYASFKVTFPDDITNWRTFTIAMADKKRSGYKEAFIKSFKALSGNIALPLFAIDGDSINVIGKTLNYLPDSIQVKRSFSLNNNLIKENMISLRNSWIDTFSITALRGDSLKLKYTVQKQDGYFDGEERSIPVFRPGVLETNGLFLSLTKDTSFSLQMKADSGVMKLYAEASLLPVFYEETESIRNYEYLCNEQLASKLKAMLVQKRIDQYLKRPFKGEDNIRDLIARLNKGKSTVGLWGWWTGNQPEIWISLHVVEALLDASKMGYTIALNKTALTDYLIYNMESYKGVDKLSSLYLLHALGAKVDFTKYIDSIEAHGVGKSIYQRLRLIELKQKFGLPVQLDTLIAKQSRTVFGNVYWGEENYFFFENSFHITLSMYRILRNSGNYNDLLLRIRNYFLEKRKDGHWRNTYESSLILETILPDLLAENPEMKPSSLTIKGKETITINKFPFQTQINSGENISITKQGSLPVYFTAFEQHWNSKPERVEGNFIVNTFFETGQQTVAKLKAGTPVTLRVKVTVKADADYVMVEIPIPAGCSYQDKSQPYWNNEVHREYFRNKASIFCKSLAKGKYEFTISLLPRYSGTYTLNPAKAEMMYFPVFYGREGIKKVKID